MSPKPWKPEGLGPTPEMLRAAAAAKLCRVETVDWKSVAGDLMAALVDHSLRRAAIRRYTDAVAAAKRLGDS